VRVVFAGTPQVALPSLEAVLASPHELVAVVTRPDAPAGRGRHLVASPVGQRAMAEGIPVLKPASPRDPDFIEQLRDLAPDCCPVVAYGALLPQPALDVPVRGWVNLHFSLLPAWRGAAPVQRALMAGDEVTGATTFRLTKGMDTGPVYGVMTEQVRPTDTSGDLLERLAVGGAALLVATLDGIASGELAPQPQPVDGVSYAPKVEVDDAHVDWTWPAARIDRLVRACTPAPGAWTTIDGQRVKLGPVRPSGDVPSIAPGVLRVGKNRVDVGTGTSPVCLGTVQAQGKKAMAAADWARGLRLGPDAGFDLPQPSDAVTAGGQNR
jgi:methionyl-tRNA formyltransferase